MSELGKSYLKQEGAAEETRGDVLGVLESSTKAVLQEAGCEVRPPEGKICVVEYLADGGVAEYTLVDGGSRLILTKKARVTQLEPEESITLPDGRTLTNSRLGLRKYLADLNKSN